MRPRPYQRPSAIEPRAPARTASRVASRARARSGRCPRPSGSRRQPASARERPRADARRPSASTSMASSIETSVPPPTLKTDPVRPRSIAAIVASTASSTKVTLRDCVPSPCSSNVPPSARHVTIFVKAMSGRCRGPVDREVAHRDGVEAELLPIRGRELLARQLRDPIRGQRLRRCALGRRIARGVAVDRGRRSEHRSDSCASRRLEQPLAGEHVLANVHREHVAEARDTRLTREVEDAVHPFEVERVLDEVDALDGQSASVLLLQRDVVVVGERVPADGVVPALQKRRRSKCEPMNPAAPVTT